ncbi:hypothetical protein THERMOT_1016 [Bathymodiolus thermophilus thioautotrophic gill symbiont]|nr:hypothetical protein THERMOT_1016 [Bathymodiolus thermophilus thioautotrophic gill symbiont]
MFNAGLNLMLYKARKRYFLVTLNANSLKSIPVKFYLFWLKGSSR